MKQWEPENSAITDDCKFQIMTLNSPMNMRHSAV